jgi:hypothetical protein
VADDFSQKPASELLTGALEWGRKQPLVALAGAALLGFVLSRVVRTGVSGGGDSQ